MSEKICKNCAHCDSSLSTYDYYMCDQFSNIVTGTLAVPCSVARNHLECGREGKFFSDPLNPTTYEIELLPPDHPTYRTGMGGMKQVIVSKHHEEIHALVAHFFGEGAALNAVEFVKWRTITNKISTVDM